MMSRSDSADISSSIFSENMIRNCSSFCGGGAISGTGASQLQIRNGTGASRIFQAFSPQARCKYGYKSFFPCCRLLQAFRKIVRQLVVLSWRSILQQYRLIALIFTIMSPLEMEAEWLA
jgi:hypothetical protein